jgi:hypothetical protein
MKPLALYLAAASMLCPCAAVAQTDVLVFPTELSASFSAVPGRVVLAGDQVLFWSDAQNYPSFYFSRSAIRRSNVASGVLTIELNEPIPIQDGRRSRFDMRLTGEADIVAAERWFSGAAAASPGNRNATPAAAASMAPGLSYMAQHSKRIGRNSSGKLAFGSDGIAWESLNDASDSRTWPYKSIRRLDRKSPYELIIDTFVDGKYSFRMDEKPISTEDFARITDFLVAARAASR